MPTELKTHIANFKDWLKTDTGNAASWQKDRRERLAWYRQHLSKDALAKLTRENFATLIKNLWAVNIWKNKDYKVEQLIKDNGGLERLKDRFAELLYGDGPVDTRWDKFRASVKGLGPSSLSEILTFHDPQEYALANLKPYRVLPLLGFSISPVNDGKSYKKAIQEIGEVKTLLEENGLKDADFILTDFFVAYLFYHVFDLQFKRKETVPKPPAEKREAPPTQEQRVASDLRIESHEAAEAALLMLGNLLGYDTYTPDAGKTCEGRKLGEIATLEELPDFTLAKIMESVEKIDVIWLKNELPECFFEVEHTTGVTSGLLRIYQAEKLAAKFFIVGPQDVLRRYEREVEKSPFNRIKDKYRFRSYDELREMYFAAAKFRKVSDHFLG